MKHVFRRLSSAVIPHAAAIAPFSPVRSFLTSSSDTTKLIPPPHPKDVGKLTVVLDMDETLLHSKFQGIDYRQAEFRAVATATKPSFQVTLPPDDFGQYPAEVVKVYERPHLRKFLAHISERYEPILFTAALPVYADPVLDEVDPGGVLRHRLYRSSCVPFAGYEFVKDIRMLGRDMARIVIVDNNPHAMLATLSNAIPIKDFYDDHNDTELVKLLGLLEHLDTLTDVRPYLTSLFGMFDDSSSARSKL